MISTGRWGRLWLRERPLADLARTLRSDRTAALRSPGDQNVFEVLARPPAGAAVDVAAEPFLELKTGSREDLRIQVAAVVDDDEDRGSLPELHRRPREYRGDAVAVRLQRRQRRPRGRRADLPLAPVVEREQLVRIAVLLVVVDQPRIRRRGEDPVERPRERLFARVAVQHRRVALRVAHAREILDPHERVAR